MQTLLVATAWVSMLMVALPLAPCAFVSSTCCQAGQAASAHAELDTAPRERACCAEHAEAPPRHSHAPADDSCRVECCRLSPFVPSIEKVLVDAPPVAIEVARPPVLLAAALSPTDVVPVGLADRPLQILHCQWRL